MLITPFNPSFSLSKDIELTKNIDNFVKFTAIRKPNTLTVKPNKIRNNTAKGKE